MKPTLAVTMLLLSIGLALAASDTRTFGPKGYLTVGDNVVLLPDYLRLGDRMIISDVKGATVFDRTISTNTFQVDQFPVASGLYLLSVLRNGQPLVSTNVSVWRGKE